MWIYGLRCCVCGTSFAYKTSLQRVKTEITCILGSSHLSLWGKHLDRSNVWGQCTLKKKLILLFCKDTLNGSKLTVKILMMLQTISISNKCYSFELFIHQILKRLKDSLDIKHQNSDSNQNLIVFHWCVMERFCSDLTDFLNKDILICQTKRQTAWNVYDWDKKWGEEESLKPLLENSEHQISLLRISLIIPLSFHILFCISPLLYHIFLSFIFIFVLFIALTYNVYNPISHLALLIKNCSGFSQKTQWRTSV